LKDLILPPEAEALRSLAAGDEVLLTGDALTMRDAALGRLQGLVTEGLEPPFEMEGQLVFYSGPCPPAAGRPCGAIGPTTSARMDPFMGTLLERGVRATLGKGPRSEETRLLHQRFGAVYFVTVGGIAALLGGRVEKIEPVAWGDLGPEAVYRVRLSGFPAVVAIDSTGRDFLAEQHLLYRRT